MKHTWWKRFVTRKLRTSRRRYRGSLRLELLEPRHLLSGYRTITEEIFFRMIRLPLGPRD
jgi:hypothetical protein